MLEFQRPYVVDLVVNPQNPCPPGTSGWDLIWKLDFCRHDQSRSHCLRVDRNLNDWHLCQRKEKQTQRDPETHREEGLVMSEADKAVTQLRGSGNSRIATKLSQGRTPSYSHQRGHSAAGFLIWRAQPPASWEKPLEIKVASSYFFSLPLCSLP